MENAQVTLEQSSDLETWKPFVTVDQTEDERSYFRLRIDK